MKKSIRLTIAVINLIIYGINGQEQNYFCGTRLVHHETLITNGFQSNEGDWPWHAAIYHFGNDQAIAYKCGGTLLNSNSVLTAAHCVYENNRVIIPERVLVQLGKHNLKVSGTNTQEFEAYKIITHPDYSTSGLNDDIAIIRLSTEAVFNNYVQPICLWHSNKKHISEIIGRHGTVVGWGVTETDQLTYILRQAAIPVVSSFMCLQSNPDFFGGFLTEKNFCGGFRNGTSVCNGDSGGGMMFEENGVYYIRGIVSLTVAKKDKRFCDTTEYVLFTDVAQYLPWIEEVVPQLKRSHSESGPDDVSTHRNLHLLPLNECGEISELIGSRFVDDKEGLFDFPWIARLQYSSDNKLKFLCTGTLISNRYVLTAASCVTKLKSTTKLVSVRLGEFDITTDKDCRGLYSECAAPVQDIPIEKVFFHPMYDTPKLANDIAVIRLLRPADTTPEKSHVRPVCLPTVLRVQLTALKGASNVGWGFDCATKKPSPVLRQSLRPVLSNDVCQKQFRSIQLNPHQICVGGGLTVNYKGQSGEPLIYPGNVNGERIVQFGILSAGVTLCSQTDKFPHIYTSVAHFMRWILDQLEP